MTLDDLFRSLSYGELSNLSMSGEGSGTIVEPKHGQVIQATNDALKDMFSRLVLRESELVIRTHDFKNLYYLRKEHAMSDPTVGPLKYILDTPDDPFTGDLVKVLRVSNEIGEELPMGDAEQWASVFLPQFDCVQFNHPGYGQVFGVIYQAYHPTLVSGGDDYLQQEVLVPPMLMESLRIKIAHLIFSSMSGQEYGTKAQSLEAQYEGKYLMINQDNLIGGAEMGTNVKLYRRGFP